MDLIQRLALFAEIVEKGNLSAAARARATTRSAISKQLAQLEQTVGMRLLNRNTRSMSLTGPGRIMYAQARQLREHCLETESLIAGLGQQVSGELRISTSLHLGRFLLPDAIRSFSDRFPEVIPSLQLSDHTTDIISEQIDLAIRIGNPRHSRLVGRRLCSNPVVMVASGRFLDREGQPDSMAALQRLPCIIYENDAVILDHWAYFENGREQAVRVQPALKTNDGQLLLDACIAGYGIALLPTYCALDAVRNGALKVVLPDVQLRDYQSVYLIYASRKHLLPALSEFLAHVLLWIGRHPIPVKSDLLAVSAEGSSQPT